MNGPFKTVSGAPCFHALIGSGNKRRVAAFHRQTSLAFPWKDERKTAMALALLSMMMFLVLAVATLNALREEARPAGGRSAAHGKWLR